MFGKFTKLIPKEIVSQVEKQVKVDLDGDGKSGGGAAPAARDGQPQFDSGDKVPQSNLSGNKKALLIGINYPGTSAALRGCINDVQNVKDKLLVAKFKFPTDSEHMRILTDDGKGFAQPTRANMIDGFKWLLAGAKANDSLFLHYSGHGGSQKDTDPNTDEIDGQDETWCPADYEKAGQIVDDELYELLVKPLPAGVRLTVVSDACHSASVLDTPFLYTIDGTLENPQIHEFDMRKMLVEAAMKAGKAFIVGDKKAALAAGMEAAKGLLQGSSQAKANPDAFNRAVQVRSSLGDVIVLSGCQDHQTSADASIGGQATGAMSWALIETFNETPDVTYTALLKALRTKLAGKFSQLPQMSSASRLKLDTVKFAI